MHEIKLYEIELPVIEQVMYICFWNKEKFKHFCKHNLADCEPEDGKSMPIDAIDNSYGICVTTSESEIYVWINDRENIGTMVHELIHAVWATISNRWFELEEELFAHIYKYVFTEAEKCRNRKQKLGTIEYEVSDNI